MSRNVKLNSQESCAYEGILFSFSEVQQEIKNMAKMVSHFLTAESQIVLTDWQKSLGDFHSLESKSGRWKWEIAEKRPIRTINSKGKYESGGRGKDVYGTISSVWEIEKHTTPHKKKAKDLFCLRGLASTRVGIYETVDGKQHGCPIVQWQFEVGDHQSPGCHFHVGIGKSSLPIPRLPNLLVTPMDALGFLLGELFLDDWKKEAGKESDEMQFWANYQKQRLLGLLRWKVDRVEESRGLPWTFLKHKRPPANVLGGNV
jgi:hypothetical protein